MSAGARKCMPWLRIYRHKRQKNLIYAVISQFALVYVYSYSIIVNIGIAQNYRGQCPNGLMLRAATDLYWLLFPRTHAHLYHMHVFEESYHHQLHLWCIDISYLILCAYRFHIVNLFISCLSAHALQIFENFYEELALDLINKSYSYSYISNVSLLITHKCMSIITCESR